MAPGPEIKQLGSRGLVGLRSLSGRVPRLCHAREGGDAKSPSFQKHRLALFLPPLDAMAAFRLKMLGGALLGLLVAVTAVTLLSAPRKTPAPSTESAPAEAKAPPVTSAPEPAPPPAPPPAPVVSRSRGEREWAFFFRPGDTLSRMADGAPLGIVVRLERQHRFADGSTGPAYVVRSPEQAETTIDADELERRARIEAIREFRLPPARLPDAPATR